MVYNAYSFIKSIMFAVGIIFSTKPSTVLATIKCLIVQIAEFYAL